MTSVREAKKPTNYFAYSNISAGYATASNKTINSPLGSLLYCYEQQNHNNIRLWARACRLRFRQVFCCATRRLSSERGCFCRIYASGARRRNLFEPRPRTHSLCTPSGHAQTAAPGVRRAVRSFRQPISGSGYRRSAGHAPPAWRTTLERLSPIRTEQLVEQGV